MYAHFEQILLTLRILSAFTSLVVHYTDPSVHRCYQVFVRNNEVNNSYQKDTTNEYATRKVPESED